MRKLNMHKNCALPPLRRKTNALVDGHERWSHDRSVLGFVVAVGRVLRTPCEGRLIPLSAL